MDRRFIWTGVALGAAIAAALAFSDLPEKSQGIPLQEPVSGIELPDRSQSAEEYAYLLKEHGGRIAVFAHGQNDPQMVLDVLVKYLPDQDRQELSQGIKVENYSDLMALIEDFSS